MIDSNSKDWIVFRIFVKKKSERKLREFYLIKFSKHEMNIARATKYLVQVDNLRKLRGKRKDPSSECCNITSVSLFSYVITCADACYGFASLRACAHLTLRNMFSHASFFLFPSCKYPFRLRTKEVMDRT